jgi:hypothetical protein
MINFLFFLQETAFCDLTKGNFYVIEKFIHPAFVMDDKGEPKRFETYQEAADEAALCQNGYVIVF